MNTHLDPLSRVRHLTAPMYRALFNQICPREPMTDSEMWNWIFTGNGPTRQNLEQRTGDETV